MLLVNVADSDTYGLSFQCKPASCTYGLPVLLHGSQLLF